jgi:hypothetical protein
MPRRRQPPPLPFMTADQLRRYQLSLVTEDAVQSQIVSMLRQLPDPPLGPAWTAINPIPAKSKAAAGMSKRLGLVAGFPDLHVLWGGRAAYAECKRPVGGKPSGDTQPAVQAQLVAAGGFVAVVTTAEQFFRFLQATFPAEWAALGRHAPILWPWLGGAR